MHDLPVVRRDPLADILEAALTDPDAVAPSSVDHVRSALEHDDSRAELALGTLAALLYARPDVVSDAILDPVAGLLCREPVPDRLLRHGRKLWEFLAASGLAARAWDLLGRVLQDGRLAPTTRARLAPVVGTFAQWREDLVDLDAVLALAASPELAPHRAALLDHAVERLVYCAPRSFTPGRLERLTALFGHLPRYRYVLYALAGRPELPAASRAMLEAQILECFAFQQASAAVLVQRPIRLLVVQNAGMGQGDDLVRLVPLLQALLDANPSLTITLLTRRTYLYDNPRVTVVAIDEDAAMQAVREERFDGMIEFFQPGWPQFAYRVDLHTALDEMFARHPPAFLVHGDLGRPANGGTERRSQFLHQRVEIGGRDVASCCRLDRLECPSSYDPGNRLLAELGLPQRAGEERPRTPSLLTGTRSTDAERVWSDLLPPGNGPVALVSPFGGSGPSKGFFRQDALLAAEIAGLVSEGYRVVVLPQDSEWARPAVIDAVLALLTADIRARVRVAPDPADPSIAVRLALVERPALSPADRVMRLFKYFAAYADVVVTVEGWLAHLAYQLGRPFRLFLAAGAFTADWFPHGRSPAQRLVPALSPRAAPAHQRSALLGPADPPPLPHYPRKHLLEVALAALGRAGGPEVAAVLRRAITSPDAKVRTWAVSGLGEIDPVVFKADLLAALEDRSAWVVRAAAAALLRGEVDCTREMGWGYRTHLRAYVDGANQNWDAVARAGSLVLPVLFRLARNELHDVQRGAKTMLRRMLSPWVPGLPSPEAPDGDAAGGGHTAAT